MKINQFFRKKRRIVDLHFNTRLVLFAKVLALVAFVSTRPAPSKEMPVFAEVGTPERECIREGDPAVMGAGPVKESLTGAVKIRATDREGNFIEITY